MDKELLFLRLNKLLELIEELERDLENTSLDQFKENSLLARATCFSIEQIGENMNHLSTVFYDSYPEIDWRDIINVRIIIAHYYHKIDYEKIYKIVKNDIPVLKEQVKQMNINEHNK